MLIRGGRVEMNAGAQRRDFRIHRSAPTDGRIVDALLRRRRFLCQAREMHEPRARCRNVPVRGVLRHDADHAVTTLANSR